MTPPPDPGTQAHEPDGVPTASRPGGGTEDHPSGSPASPPPTAAAGLPAIPGYEVTGEIARGGMGRVLAARCRRRGWIGSSPRRG